MGERETKSEKGRLGERIKLNERPIHKVERLDVQTGAWIVIFKGGMHQYVFVSICFQQRKMRTSDATVHHCLLSPPLGAVWAPWATPLCLASP